VRSLASAEQVLQAKYGALARGDGTIMLRLPKCALSPLSRKPSLFSSGLCFA
jgi:hypothetical protein